MKKIAQFGLVVPLCYRGLSLIVFPEQTESRLLYLEAAQIVKPAGDLLSKEKVVDHENNDNLLSEVLFSSRG